MLEELKQAQKVVGSKQARRALRDGRAKKIYIARDADPRILQPLVQEAVRAGVRVEPMAFLVVKGGVGAAIAAVV